MGLLILRIINDIDPGLQTVDVYQNIRITQLPFLQRSQVKDRSTIRYRNNNLSDISTLPAKRRNIVQKHILGMYINLSFGLECYIYQYPLS